MIVKVNFMLLSCPAKAGHPVPTATADQALHQPTAGDYWIVRLRGR